MLKWLDYTWRICKDNLPNRRVEKILGMCGQGPSGRKRRHILPWTSSRSESTHRSSTKAVAGSWTRKGPLSFQAVDTMLLRSSSSPASKIKLRFKLADNNNHKLLLLHNSINAKHIRGMWFLYFCAYISWEMREKSILSKTNNSIRLNSFYGR